MMTANVMKTGYAGLLAALYLCWSPVAAGEQFERLFTRPGERLQLDLVKAGLDVPPVADPASTPTQVSADTRTLRYSGYVRRGDGKTYQWVDGLPAHTEQGTASGNVRRAEFERGTHRTSLLAGQTWHLATDTVLEAYQSIPETPDEPGSARAQQTAQ